MKVKDISKSFGNRTLFSSLTFSFSKGLLVLKGKSGCGKTTLRKIRMGKEKPAKGTVVPFSSFSYCGRDDSLFSVFSLKKNLFIFNKEYDKEKLDALLTSFSFESYFATRSYPIISKEYVFDVPEIAWDEFYTTAINLGFEKFKIWVDVISEYEPICENTEDEENDQLEEIYMKA